MKFCPQCGAQLDDSAVFCCNCGANLGTAQTQQSYAQDEYSQPSYPQDAYAQQPYTQDNYAQQPYGQTYAQGGYDPNAYAQGYQNYAGGYGQPAGYAQPGGYAATYDLPPAEKPRPAGLSIASFILSFFGITSPIALILAIVALATRNRKKGLAIAAIIISVFASALVFAIYVPQIIKYTEKTNVSSDTQYCDSLQAAITTAMMDPYVINSSNSGIPASNVWLRVEDINENTEFGKAVCEIMGCHTYEFEGKIKSSYQGDKANGLEYRIENGNRVKVRIANSDSTGRKGSYGPNPIQAY